ncbi:MAG: response regulator [Elusimicrobia bacterium]|nr:response regulator [Elusimicrobiota bacterium]
MTNILIVDDEVSIRELLRDVLEAEGRTFTLASSGAEALEKIGKTRFDLVLIDWSMPGMSGIQALRTLRANPATAQLKVIMCTGADVLAQVDEAFSAGATDYVVKPVNFEKLRAKVAAHTRPS